MTPIADMVDGMVLAGASPVAIAVAVRAMESVTPVTDPVTPLPPLPVTRSRAAIKQAAYRARKSAKNAANIGESVALAAVSESPEHPVTPAVTSGNAAGNAVTDAPLSILTSLELSQGKPKEESKEVVRSTDPRARTKRTASRMADDWRPDDKGMKFAADHGLRLYEIENEITKFRNYWVNRTDKLAAKPRWDLAWENWILNARNWNGQGNSQSRGNSASGPAQTHGDNIVAGMANYAAKRLGRELPASRGEVRGCPDAAGEPVADRDAESSHSATLHRLEIDARANTRSGG